MLAKLDTYSKTYSGYFHQAHSRDFFKGDLGCKDGGTVDQSATVGARYIKRTMIVDREVFTK